MELLHELDPPSGPGWKTALRSIKPPSPGSGGTTRPGAAEAGVLPVVADAPQSPEGPGVKVVFFRKKNGQRVFGS